MAGNTGTCVSVTTGLPFRLTIEATAQQCGTFQNTPRARGAVLFGPARFDVTDTEEITVEGCEEPPLPPPAVSDQQQEGVPASLTQEGEQDSESGEVDQDFEVG